jgi:hypothetical protein
MVADVSDLIPWESGVMPDPRVLVTISHAEAGHAQRRAMAAVKTMTGRDDVFMMSGESVQVVIC